MLRFWVNFCIKDNFIVLHFFQKLGMIARFIISTTNRYCGLMAHTALTSTNHASKNNPIGVFDSGVGGLSIYRHLKAVLPNERFIYYADTKNLPYGNKSGEHIIDLTRQAVDWLMQQHCKLIVVACNSASAYALNVLRGEYAVPIVGLVPAIKPACALTTTKKIAVLATQATLSGNLFQDVIAQHATANGIHVFTHFEPKLVPWVEDGMPINHEVADLLIKKMYAWADLQVDTLVLGCTHYPFFRDFLQADIVTNRLNLTLIDSGLAIAERVKSLLNHNDQLSHRHATPPLWLHSSGFLDNPNDKTILISQRLIDLPIEFIDTHAQILQS